MKIKDRLEINLNYFMREMSGETGLGKHPTLKTKTQYGGVRDYIRRSKYLTTSFIVEFSTAEKNA